MHHVGRCSGRSGRSSTGSSLGRRHLGHHAARCGRMACGGLWFRCLVLEHAMWLTTAARLVLPEARRCRTGLFDLHVAHRAGAIVALPFLPQLAGFLVAKCRRFVAVLAIRSLLTCRVVEEVAVMQVPR